MPAHTNALERTTSRLRDGATAEMKARVLGKELKDQLLANRIKLLKDSFGVIGACPLPLSAGFALLTLLVGIRYRRRGHSIS